MKYQLEMRPSHLVVLNELLRVTPAEFEDAIRNDEVDTPARRILRARVCLDLSNSYQVLQGCYIGDAIIDMKATPLDPSVPLLPFIATV